MAIKPLVGSFVVVIDEVFSQQSFQAIHREWYEMVANFAPDGADKTFNVTVEPGRFGGEFDRLAADAAQTGLGLIDIQGVAIPRLISTKVRLMPRS